MPWDTTRPRNNRYGAAHQKARKQWAAQHQPSDPCTRCGHPLGPMGPHLHLDHAADGITYRGFSHGTRCPVCGLNCNIRAGALAANARSKARRLGGLAPIRAPRDWT
jgi:hypothetical protein